ncbi:MAG: hypothetical protein IE889_02210 [Campylobacterales bacterium]|nr:hypothetical protein [Campylobacterales bacterium]
MRIVTFMAIILAFSFCIYRCIEELKGLPDDTIVRDKKIFIIGDSTVRYDYDEQRMGWGTPLVQEYMLHPENGFNEARRGATAESYRVMDEYTLKNKGTAYWEQTKKLIQSTPDHEGGYLLIQFGSNDNIANVPQEQFVKALKSYIDEAKTMQLIPVLISPPNTRLKINGKAYNNRGAFPQYIETVAKAEQVLYLNLHRKSLEMFSPLTESELADQFGAVPFPEDGRLDTTHFNPQGAKVVAGWVKELVCEQDRVLCAQFRKN